MQVLIYHDTKNEGTYQVLYYAIRSHAEAVLDLWRDSKKDFMSLTCLMPFIGWIIFIISLLPTHLLEILKIVKKKRIHA